ncbi:hypothetical protein E4U53_007102 [Claviceps sorghi]|nr:hypothetical protein E4U53_007102 [Claviceps sorghi]
MATNVCEIGGDSVEPASCMTVEVLCEQRSGRYPDVAVGCKLLATPWAPIFYGSAKMGEVGRQIERSVLKEMGPYIRARRHAPRGWHEIAPSLVRTGIWHGEPPLLLCL